MLEGLLFAQNAVGLILRDTSYLFAQPGGFSGFPADLA